MRSIGPRMEATCPRRWARVAVVWIGFSASALAQTATQPEEGDKQVITQKPEEAAHPTILGPLSLFGIEPVPLKEPLVTDRPDFTESSVTIPRGHVQLESGYTFTYDKENDVRVKDHAFPEWLFRVGLHEDFELRIGWEGWSLTRDYTHEVNDYGRKVGVQTIDNGNTDMTLGGKIHLLDQVRYIPELGFIVDFSVPSGSTTKTSGDVDPQVVALWSYDLTERWSLAGNVGVGVATSGDHRFVQSLGSISLGYSLTDRLGSFVEYFGLYPNGWGTDCAHSVDGGLTYLITDNLQLDLRVGAGLNEEADDFFTGIGVSCRW